MRVPTSIQFRNIPFYLLTLSLFFNNLFLQYGALGLFLIFSLLRWPVIRSRAFFQLPMVLFCWVIISYLINLVIGRTDVYSIIFWFFSYLPPFLLAWLILSYRGAVEVKEVYSFYKKLVYLQTVLLIVSAIQHRSYVVGDDARGTVGDANWVAFHICVVIIYELTQLVTLTKAKALTTGQRTKRIIELVYMFIVLIIPESTANLALIFLMIGLLFFREYLQSRLNPASILVFIVIAAAGFFIVSDTLVFRRIENAVSTLASTGFEGDHNYFKLSIYKKVLNGDVFQQGSFIIGSGPSTFTSRSSVVRMPEERVNQFPIELPYFKSATFATHISPVYAEWRASGEGYGNFASPQTSVISVLVELGIIGFMLFAAFFYFIYRGLRRSSFAVDPFLPKFARYFTLFFIISLFHLNFWEYPIISFTYMLFTFLIIKKSGGIARMTEKKPDAADPAM